MPTPDFAVRVARLRQTVRSCCGPTQVDRAVEVPPPIMVVVMGPRGSGKTTLIGSLIKLYTGETSEYENRVLWGNLRAFRGRGKQVRVRVWGGGLGWG